MSSEPSRQDLQVVERWSEEVVRLRDMLESLEKQKHQCVWFLKIGGALALPSLWFAWWAPLFVLAFAVTSWGTGQYFSWGHLIDRRQQLQWAKKQLRDARVKVGLPPLEPVVLLPVDGEEPLAGKGLELAALDGAS